MKWQEDLIRDIRTHSDYDYKDLPELEGVISHPLGYTFPEITECNQQALLEQFLKVQPSAKSILELGIGRNGKDSFAYVFSENKRKETIYVGIDIENRSFLNDEENKIYTIQRDSLAYEENIKEFQKIGVEKFDFIFIDTPHSINQLLLDWEYTNLLADGGIVGFHDTSCHPGPYEFVKSLDKTKWDVIENCCPEDWGIGFAWKRN
jgi:predicted O-methyltransferase YrrM